VRVGGDGRDDLGDLGRRGGGGGGGGAAGAEGVGRVAVRRKVEEQDVGERELAADGEAVRAERALEQRERGGELGGQLRLGDLLV
jgi:hypothetical protein